MSNDRGRALLVLFVFILTLGLTAGNLFFHLRSLFGTEFYASVDAAVQSLRDAYTQQPDMVLFLGAAPLVAGLLLTLVIGLRREGSQDVATSESTPDDTGSAAGAALRLLALLQQEGRLIDFLEEDIDGYGDAQVGSAARTIHSGCRKALRERMQIERIFDQEDGTTIEVAPGFDPGEVRLTGSVHGQPPFQGTLQHGGWRVSRVNLPSSAKGIDPTILAPAEVEVGAGGRESETGR